MKTKKEPCNECPFTRTSLPGWLGPWEPDELLSVIRYQNFPCHQTIRENGMAFSDPRLKTCAGAAIFMSNKMQVSRNHEMAAQQKELRGCPKELKETIFQNDEEFRRHHVRSW